MGTVQYTAATLALLLFMSVQTIQLHHCHGASTISCRGDERKALLRFKAAVGNSNGQLSSWVGQDCCSWKGVVCNNRADHVIRLELAYKGLVGRVPADLGDLSSLGYLDLSGNNQLEIGDSSLFSNLSSLQYLNLGSMVIKNVSLVLASIGMLPLLSELHLSNSLPFIPVSLPRHVNFSSLEILDLSANYFNTTIPPWLFEIGSLRHLDLYANEFIGHVPNTISNLLSLEVLDMSGNKFLEPDVLTAATGIAKLSNLTKIAWKSSNLRGQLPQWLDDLKKLKTLDLSANSLSGPIPSYQLPVLEKLDLSDNQLNEIPLASLGQLSKLAELNLGQNPFDGILTEKHINNLTSLEYLKLSSNSLIIDINLEWTPSPLLAEMDLDDCQVGPGFPTWLQKMKNISRISMSNAKISDVVPYWFWNFSSNLLNMNLSNNMIRGKLPTSFHNLNIQFLDLSNNQLEGPFPYYLTNIVMLYLANNSLSGPIPPNIGEIMTSMVGLHVSANKLSGSIPSSMCQMETLFSLDLSENKLSGGIPDCWSNIYFNAIDLGGNNLSGAIPPSFCSNPLNLESLHLENNNLSGNFSLALQNCASLKTLDLGHNKLDGNIPTWIGNNLTYLRILVLGSNMFVGEIPSNLGSLHYLRVIDLSDNMLSGTVPQSFSNFSAMKVYGAMDTNSEGYQDNVDVFMKGRVARYGELLPWLISIDLSSNRLSGEIPEGIANLHELQNLNLSRNHLTGTIPRNVTGLQKLESLDLSFNSLRGEIPQSLTSLSFLGVMNFSFNNFSGRIPTGGQFDSHPDSSIYMGNDYLCGFPLTPCEGNVTSPAPQHDNTHESETKDVWFYLSLVLGYIVGFWLFSGVLLVKMKWRIAYYGYIDRVYDILYVYIAVKLAKMTRR